MTQDKAQANEMQAGELGLALVAQMGYPNAGGHFKSNRR